MDLITKQIPKDFMVKEIQEIELNEKGKLAVFELEKKEYSMIRAIDRISSFFKIPKNKIRYSGIKDKFAITYQKIGIENRLLKKDLLKDNEINDELKLKFLGFTNQEIYIGSLQGNEFEINLRNIPKEKEKVVKNYLENYSKKEKNNSYTKEIIYPNYYGIQRFSEINVEVGIALIKKDYKKAINLIIESNFKEKKILEDWLEKYKNEYVNVLRKLNKDFFKLYIHSVQSKIFNEVLENKIGSKYTKDYEIYKNLAKEIELVGYDSKDKTNLELLNQYNIKPFDFINRQINYLTIATIKRDTTIKTNTEIKISEDELNKDKIILNLKFKLPKGCYATELIEQLKYEIFE